MSDRMADFTHRRAARRKACAVHRTRGAVFAAALAMAFVAIVGDAVAADAVPAAAPPVRFEKAADGVERVILSERAAERLGIRIERVTEQTVPRTQIVGGVVVADPGEGASRDGVRAQARAAATVARRVRVSLTPGEWERLAKDRPARILSLEPSRAGAVERWASPSGEPPVEDARRSMLAVHYVLTDAEPPFAANERVRVALALAADASPSRVVPYGAIYYAGADPSVYVAVAPLVFERRAVDVERVVGDLAVLASGPPVGTPVVSVGAALLHGAQVLRR
jgi:hypothetical protein